MTTVNVHEAKTRLSELLGRVEKGEEVVVARAGHPVARIVPIDLSWRRPFGAMQFEVPDSFFEPLPEAELAAWE